jgi:hypothetical protein
LTIWAGRAEKREAEHKRQELTALGWGAEEASKPTIAIPRNDLP